nr:circadian-associated transcriptional repressor [Podarcis muralis]XP_028566684.1 circadian-associated transcriptional repressor [Podarcis muralis]
MAAMDSSSKSISSGESLYSVESATSEDDDDRSADFEVFSDGGSDAEKEHLKHRRGAYPGRQPFLFSPEPLGQTSPSPLCRERNRRTRKPLGLLAAARLRPTGLCCRHPAALDEAYYSRLADTGSGLPRKPVGRRRAENGRCQNGGVQPHPYAAQPPLRGVKRQRNHVADREDVRSPCWTERDHIFAQKCLELQGFIHPLVELLNRLKMGRFDRGLSSFQQSVAMDRIQRIIGVLQKPEMGERYLGTLLQVERMLKLWFPHIAVRNACADCSVAATQDSCDTAEPSSMEENLPETRLPSGQGPARSPPTEGTPPDAPWGPGFPRRQNHCSAGGDSPPPGRRLARHELDVDSHLAHFHAPPGERGRGPGQFHPRADPAGAELHCLRARRLPPEQPLWPPHLLDARPSLHELPPHRPAAPGPRGAPSVSEPARRNGGRQLPWSRAP